MLGLGKKRDLCSNLVQHFSGIERPGPAQQSPMESPFDPGACGRPNGLRNRLHPVGVVDVRPRNVLQKAAPAS